MQITGRTGENETLLKDVLFGAKFNYNGGMYTRIAFNPESRVPCTEDVPVLRHATVTFLPATTPVVLETTGTTPVLRIEVGSCAYFGRDLFMRGSRLEQTPHDCVTLVDLSTGRIVFLSEDVKVVPATVVAEVK